MVCSWEMNPYGSVLAVILHTDAVCLSWALGLRQLRFPGGGAILPISGQPFSMARNSGAMKALELGVDWCLMMDSDIIAPPDAIERLMKHNHPIISAAYFRRSPPHGIMVAQKPLGNWVTKWQPNSLIEVDVAGTGFMLIRRDVLENMKPQRPGFHWFHWMVDTPKETLQAGEHCVSEDFSFCLAAKRQLGIPTVVDTSVIVKHVGLSEFTHNHVQPLQAFMCN